MTQFLTTATGRRLMITHTPGQTPAVFLRAFASDMAGTSANATRRMTVFVINSRA